MMNPASFILLTHTLHTIPVRSLVFFQELAASSNDATTAAVFRAPVILGVGGQGERDAERAALERVREDLRKQSEEVSDPHQKIFYDPCYISSVAAPHYFPAAC